MGLDSLAQSVARCAIRAGTAILLKRAGFMEWVVTRGREGVGGKIGTILWGFLVEDAMQSELAAAGYWKRWYLVWRSTKPNSEREAVVGDLVRVNCDCIMLLASVEPAFWRSTAEFYILLNPWSRLLKSAYVSTWGVKWMRLQTGVVLTNGRRVGH